MRRVTESDPIDGEELRALARERELDSMINIRPSFGNRSRGVDDPATRAAVSALVERLVRR
jgi:hypothetical protein